ncbi:MAG TPA: AsmA-like C-terminal region-containing protein [Gemmatimonadaceae bacterium]|nr:AsmA-like C-terminal region-containing protein [Gemmatimonadaceae bacterium]
MTRRAKLMAAVAALIALVVVVLLVAPLLFRDRIAQRAKLEVNRNVNARVDWRDVGLSFFRSFPHLTFTLDDLTAVGTGRFENDTLASVRHLRVVLDLASVLGNVMGGRPLVVRAVELDHPRLALIQLEDGSANWDITKKPATQPQPQASKPLAISLRSFDISDAYLALDNRQSKLEALVVGFDANLSGDFSQSQVAIRTRAHADTASVAFAGIPYLNRVALGVDADVQADLAKKIYTLKSTKLSLNKLELAASGSAASAGQRFALDLAFKSPATDFRDILSLVPAIYAHDFAKVKTTGSFAIDGRVKGDYGPGAFPSFAINTKVNDATFQYQDLPLPARSIFVDLSLSNPGGSADSTVVKLDRFHIVLGDNPIDAHMLLRTPISDPDVDARVAGKVDLGDLRRTVKLEGIDQLSGTVASDAAVRTRLSYVRKKQYEKVAASGTVDAANITVKGKTLPHPLAIQQASLALAPQHAQLKSFAGTVGSSDVQASGSLDNLLGFVLQDDTLRGSATVKSNRFNLDEWKSGDGDLQTIPVPPKIDFTLDATVAELSYDKLKMSNVHGRLTIRNQRATLDNFTMSTLGGQIGVSGWYETTTPTLPKFDVAYKMNNVDIASAFQAFSTVQALAPIAKYASGRVTTAMHLDGTLGKNMMPQLPSLSGEGTHVTTQIALHDFPALQKVADVTKLQFLKNPTLQPLKAAFAIQNGRLIVKPFDVKAAGISMNVAGSNGFDQSLLYTLGLRVPRSMLGGGANDAIAGLVSKAGGAGINLAAAPEIPLAVQIGGTVTSPTVKVDVSTLASSVTKSVTAAVTTKASAEATRLVQEAEQRAAGIRKDAQALADKVKAEGYRQADSLVAKAGGNPFVQAAAKPAADRLRKQADDKSADIVRAANDRADSVVAAARRQAEKSPPPR